MRLTPGRATLMRKIEPVRPSTVPSLLSATEGRAPRRAASRTEQARQRFLLLLLLSTWVPVAFFILTPTAQLESAGLYGLKTVFLFLGTAHVPATLFFYTDRDFRAVIRNHKTRYIIFPVALTILTGVLFALANAAVQGYLLLFFWGWQAFHYGRQNIGVYAFAAIAQGGRAPHRLEKLAIDLGTLCGIAGTFRILGMGAAPPALHGFFQQLYLIGGIAYAGVLLFGLFVYIKFFRETTTLKTLFFWTLILFFLPVFLSTNVNVAFVSYAIAHGLQYIIFMGVISLGSRAAGDEEERAVSYRSALLLMLFIVVVGLLFFSAGSLKDWEAVRGSALMTRAVDFLVGAVVGATMAHFVVDANAWKLSLAPQRAYISDRFRFIFNPAKLEKPQA